jgi:hypothetical protein
VSGAFPLVRRALKVLSEREVTPQLGLLKSTLLQLDSTFSEKSYGAGSFRDFAEKLAQAGLLRLNQAGRNLLVEIKETDAQPGEEPADAAPADRHQPDRQHGERHHGDRDRGHGLRLQVAEREPVAEEAPAGESQPHAEPPAATPVIPGPGEALAVQQAEAIALLRQVIENATAPLRWPMYVRNVKQLLRAADTSFDERRYGFGGILDLLRGAQRDALLRLERDRQGVLRVFPGNALQRPSALPPVQEAAIDEAGPSEAAPVPAEAESSPGAAAPSTPEPAAAPPPSGPEALPVIEAETLPSDQPPEVVVDEPTAAPRGPKRRRGGTGARKTAGVRKLVATKAKPAKKKKE